MSQMHLKQPRFTYSADGPFANSKKRIQKFKEMGDTKYIYKNELDKTCFHYDMSYGDFRELAKRTASEKVLRDKAFNIAKNPKCDGYQRDLASMVYKKCRVQKEISKLYVKWKGYDNSFDSWIDKKDVT